MLGWEKEGLGVDGSFAAPSGVAKAGPGLAGHVPSQSTMFVSLMSRDLV